MTTINTRMRRIEISTQKNVHYIRRKPVPYDEASVSSASSSKTVIDGKARRSSESFAPAPGVSTVSSSTSEPDSEPFRQLLSYRILMSKDVPAPDSDEEQSSMASPRRPSHTSSCDPKTRSPSLSISSVESIEELYDHVASACVKDDTFSFNRGLHRARTAKHRQTLHSFDPSADCSPLSTVADLPMVDDSYAKRASSGSYSLYSMPKGYWNRPLMEDNDRFDGFTPPIFAEEVNWGTAL